MSNKKKVVLTAEEALRKVRGKNFTTAKLMSACGVGVHQAAALLATLSRQNLIRRQDEAGADGTSAWRKR